MALDYHCSSAEDVATTQALIDKLKHDDREIFQYMWISQVKDPSENTYREAASLNFPIQCFFGVALNKNGGSEYWHLLPDILYRAFGPGKLLVFDLNNEIIPMPDIS